ncbi:MAG: lysine 2,3-aminomutase [Candidatus Krumholzibacteria bacterium]|nr:lysine 2,3-aminomutase [Candidatus Krumholzibacteria bacterium]MDH4337626.1 lysine 2,3-aminomutase [Candidatus Krumholzibacteria bacterium]MDH5270428.1 lysine 2,3-aminomutase [Candidatus Krumholzibacteria bacterium]
MIRKTRIAPRKYRAFTQRDIDRIPQLRLLDADHRLRMKAVATVLPFRVNEYVLDELIDWTHVPDDPMFQLTFPQEGMLETPDLNRMVDLLKGGAPEEKIKKAAREIQMSLNPHPAGQMELNVPLLHGKPVPGLQHKYRETVLAFPSQGQTCHAYCTYCFRWAQFVGIDDLKFAAREAEALAAYLRDHTEVQSLLFTGGDPMIMKTAVIRRYVEPLLDPEFGHLVSLRFGTKATAYWPYRFLTDPDADDLLRLFEDIVKAGRHVAVMAHYSHPRELETAVAQAAVRRILSTGAVIRCQAPLIKRVNDNAVAWSDMWRIQVALGAVPYYMFVERDTGPKNYFEVPLARALGIFTDAYTRVSGLARTVRGPSMSATPGKVLVDGVATVNGEKVFVLKFLQARDPAWVNRPFFAKFDPKATWLTDLEPAFGESEFFFTKTMSEMKRRHRQPAWGEATDERRSLVLFGNVEWE